MAERVVLEGSVPDLQTVILTVGALTAAGVSLRLALKVRNMKFVDQILLVRLQSHSDSLHSRNTQAT